MRDPVAHWKARAETLATVVAAYRRHLLALADLLPHEHLWALDTPVEVLETLIRQIDVEQELRSSAHMTEGDVESELRAVWRRLAPDAGSAHPTDRALLARYR